MKTFNIRFSYFPEFSCNLKFDRIHIEAVSIHAATMVLLEQLNELVGDCTGFKINSYDVFTKEV